MALDRPARDARGVRRVPRRRARRGARRDGDPARDDQPQAGVVGSTRFLALRPEHGSVEIGWTWLHPSAWGTGVNVEAKLLMLRQAFEVWGCRRVELKTDAQNERSRGAMEAMGARFEGVHRKHMLVRDGENRDSAWYSIVDDEWPEVAVGRLARVLALAAPTSILPVARYPRGTGAREMIESVNVIGARGRVGRRSARASPSAAFACSPTAAPSSSCSASPTGRSPRSRPSSRRDRGSRT